MLCRDSARTYCLLPAWRRRDGAYQGGGQFKARDDQGRTIFSVAADVRGLYYLNNVTISNPIPPVAKAPTNIRGQRNFLPSMVGNEISKASQFFAMGVKDKNCKVSLHLRVGMWKLKKQGVTRNLSSLFLLLREERRITLLLSFYIHLYTFPQRLTM